MNNEQQPIHSLMKALGMKNPYKLPKEKVQTECLLNGCFVLTSHNKGFCCAEHYKLYKTEIKQHEHIKKKS